MAQFSSVLPKSNLSHAVYQRWKAPGVRRLVPGICAVRYGFPRVARPAEKAYLFPNENLIVTLAARFNRNFTEKAGTFRGIILAMETKSLDFLYLESDPRTGQPSACICVKPTGTQDYAGVEAERLVSAHCMSFIELDAERRQLHAELDEIRARAKKKFYKAEAVAAAAGA